MGGGIEVVAQQHTGFQTIANNGDYQTLHVEQIIDRDGDVAC